MADITAQTPTRAANQLTTAAAAAGGDAFANNGRELVLFRHTNAGGSNVTVTIVSQSTVDSIAALAVADLTFTLVAGQDHLLGPFPKGIYDDGDGKVQITYSSETDVELAVIDPRAS